MVSLTLSVPDELKARMDKFNDMNWSSVARNSIEKKVELMEAFREFTKDSTMTEEDALMMGKKVNKAIAKRFREEAKRGRKHTIRDAKNTKRR